MKRFTLVIFIFIVSAVNAQTKDFKIPDSLEGKKFWQLRSSFYASKSKILDSIYANTYIKKGMIVNDSIKIAKGYLFLSSTAKNDIEKEILIDHSISYSKNKNNFHVPCTAYSIKANIYKEKRNYEEALKYLLLAYNSSKKGNNVELSYLTIYNLGLLKNEIGHHDETIKYMTQVLDYFEDEKKYSIYLSSMCMLSNSYTYKKKNDSATIINSTGIKKSLIQKNYEHYWYFVFFEGINKFYTKNYRASVDSITKAIPFLKTSDNKYKLAIAYSYLGRAFNKMNFHVESQSNLKKVDSMFIEDNYLPIYCRDIYEVLWNYDEEKKLYYIEQLLKLDKILNKNYKNISSTLYTKHEVAQLKNEKERLTKIYHKEKNQLNNFLLVILFALILISFGFYYNYYKKKNYQSKYKELIDRLDNNYKKDKNVIATVNEIEDSVVESVLKKLKDFEDENGFLRQKMTISVLAKKLNTNIKYLSKILNTNKQKKYTDYINDLRINYIISELRSNPQMRKYTIDVIASEAGFNSRRSFSDVFLKKTGISVSYYISKLDKELLD